MSTKNKKLLLSSVVFNILGLVLIFVALPIEKLSALLRYPFAGLYH